MFFCQAEDGIRDAHWGLEFRRVLFRLIKISGNVGARSQPASKTAALIARRTIFFMVKFQLPPALAHAAHRVCATCPQKLRPCAPRPPLCALAPTLRRGAGRSSSTRFRAGCALEGQQLDRKSVV